MGNAIYGLYILGRVAKAHAGRVELSPMDHQPQFEIRSQKRKRRIDLPGLVQRPQVDEMCKL